MVINLKVYEAVYQTKVHNHQLKKIGQVSRKLQNQHLEITIGWLSSFRCNICGVPTVLTEEYIFCRPYYYHNVILLTLRESFKDLNLHKINIPLVQNFSLFPSTFVEIEIIQALISSSIILNIFVHEKCTLLRFS